MRVALIVEGEDGDRNVSKCLPENTVSHIRVQFSELLPSQSQLRIIMPFKSSYQKDVCIFPIINVSCRIRLLHVRLFYRPIDIWLKIKIITLLPVYFYLLLELIPTPRVLTFSTVFFFVLRHTQPPV